MKKELLVFSGIFLLIIASLVGGAPSRKILTQANILGEVSQPPILEEHIMRLNIKIIEVVDISGQPLIQKGDAINLFVSGLGDLGCKDLDGDGAIRQPAECENIGKPEKIWAKSKVITLKVGDKIRSQIICGELKDDKCSNWDTPDSNIEIIVAGEGYDPNIEAIESLDNKLNFFQKALNWFKNLFS